jgi:hypothetical protein
VSWPNVPLAVAFSLLLPLQASAGGMAVTSARPPAPATTIPTPRPATNDLRVTSAPIVISVAVIPAVKPVGEPVYVDLRGPDGQVRRFPVVGGQNAIQSPTIVLHPGQSVNIQWAAK